MSWKHRLHCKSGKEEKKKCFVKQVFSKKRKRLKLYIKSKESDSFIKER